MFANTPSVKVVVNILLRLSRASACRLKVIAISIEIQCFPIFSIALPILSNSAFARAIGFFNRAISTDKSNNN